ncbi:glycosyltransferase [Aliarcobacter lanthieri]|uniref:glycosyltransferase n=1 Tax=Aliarcobacter lanthieri TaxID=1355374 RepID=UPI003AAD1E2F
MKILAITANYPHITNEYSGIFVKNTLQELAKLGNEIVVITPQKFHKKKMPYFQEENGLKVYRPTYITYSAKNILGFNTIKLSHKSFEKAVFKTLKNIDFVPDAIYSHFLFPAGNTASKVGEKLNKKVFCALGEDNILVYSSSLGNSMISKTLNNIDILIPNNYQIENILKNQFSIPSNKIKVIYNGVDIKTFYFMNKEFSRTKLSLPIEERIVLFVGNFEDRKGPLRVLEACKMLEKTPKIIFIGSGNQILKDENIIFCGKVSHDKLPYYLNACDVFVFPSKSEGMPNALLEAMACNCNIVSSNIDVNQFILREYGSKVICEPTDITSISEGIQYFIEKRSNSSNIFKFTLLNRVKKIEKLIIKGI